MSPPLSTISPVSLATGSDHVDIIFQALQPFKKQIAAAIGNRPVLIEPNCVSHGSTALADTPVECLEGIMEFLKSIGKTNVTVAENCPGGLTMTAFSLTTTSPCSKISGPFQGTQPGRRPADMV